MNTCTGCDPAEGFCAQCREAELREENKRLRGRLAEAEGHLVRVMSDSWTYVHGHCTIRSVFKVWDDARDYCGRAWSE